VSTRAKLGVGLAISAAGIIASGTIALAGHDHYVLTPNGKCHQVAAGQTAIDDPGHGGRHRYHANVHIGATKRPRPCDRSPTHPVPVHCVIRPVPPISAARIATATGDRVPGRSTRGEAARAADEIRGDDRRCSTP
jgi:hypothetical protein